MQWIFTKVELSHEKETLLTVCLTLCTIFYLPVRAAEEVPEEYSEDSIAPQSNNSGYLAGVVEDTNGYWYFITCVTDFTGSWAIVSTRFDLMNHRFATEDEMNAYAKAEIKAISSHADVVLWNSGSNTFGTIGYINGASYEHTHTNTYVSNVLSVLGRHGFGSDHRAYTIYNTQAY